MCGIAGFYNVGNDSAEYPEILSRMLGAIKYRGPDESGMYFDHHVALGSNRLAVIDLIGGTQPIGTSDGRWWIVFNGEIFNYIELRTDLERCGCVFRTRSDTEVLLYALITWGERALDYLDGQFAFAFYDRVESTVLLARDPFGERPLFYASQGKGLAFASEIKALFHLPQIERTLSVQALRRVYRLWTSINGDTCFTGIRSLPPGHLLRGRKNGLEVRPYYRLPIGSTPLSCSLEEAQKMVSHALQASTERRLRSDVEVACYLSGGLDSTITTAIAKSQSRRPVRAFSIAFDDATFDESHFQALAARHLDVSVSSIRMSLHAIASVFPDVVLHAETALFRTAPAPMYRLAEAVHKEGIKVVLTGEGADEAFLGYDLFKETLFRSHFHAYSDNEDRLKAIQRMYSYLPHFNTSTAILLLRFFSQFTGHQRRGLFSHETRFANGALAGRLLIHDSDPNDPFELLSQEIYSLYPDFDQATILERAQVIEYMTLLAGYLLSSQGDRMTSAHGVEGRCPFLARSVVELALQLPQKYRLDENFNEKLILKQTFGGLLPAEIANRPKQPYRAPDAAAFLGADRPEWVCEMLEPSRIEEVGMFDSSQVVAFIRHMESLPPERISPREDQAMILCLSTILLHELFIRHVPPQCRLQRFDRVVDGRK